MLVCIISIVYSIVVLVLTFVFWNFAMDVDVKGLSGVLLDSVTSENICVASAMHYHP